MQKHRNWPQQTNTIPKKDCTDVYQFVCLELSTRTSVVPAMRSSAPPATKQLTNNSAQPGRHFYQFFHCQTGIFIFCLREGVKKLNFLDDMSPIDLFQTKSKKYSECLNVFYILSIKTIFLYFLSAYRF